MSHRHHIYDQIQAIDPYRERFFHGRITREEAERRLQNTHPTNNGLYLLREDAWLDGCFVLSLRHEGRVKHYNIERDFTRCTVSILGSTRKFRGPLELVQYYSEVESSGLPCKLRQPCLLPDGVSATLFTGLSREQMRTEMIAIAKSHKLSDEEIQRAVNSFKRHEFEKLMRKFMHQNRVWFHGIISEKKAGKRLKEAGCQDGLFLVIANPKFSGHVLFVCCNMSVHRYAINTEAILGQVFIEGGAYFDSLLALIDYHEKKKDNLVCVLGTPCVRLQKPGASVKATHIPHSVSLTKTFQTILSIESVQNHEAFPNAMREASPVSPSSGEGRHVHQIPTNRALSTTPITVGENSHESDDLIQAEASRQEESNLRSPSLDHRPRRSIAEVASAHENKRDYFGYLIPNREDQEPIQTETSRPVSRGAAANEISRVQGVQEINQGDALPSLLSDRKSNHELYLVGVEDSDEQGMSRSDSHPLPSLPVAEIRPVSSERLQNNARLNFNGWLSPTQPKSNHPLSTWDYHSDSSSVDSTHSAAISVLEKRSQRLSDSNPISLVFPSAATAREELELMDKWKSVITKPTVKHRLRDVIGIEMFSYFPQIAKTDEQRIRQRFRSCKSHEAADLFLEKLTTKNLQSIHNFCRALCELGHYTIWEDLYDQWINKDDTEECSNAPFLPKYPSMTRDQIDIETLHSTIWADVINKHMVELRNVPYKSIETVFSEKIHRFHEMYGRDFKAEKANEGEMSAVEWILRKLQTSHSAWPDALLTVLEDHRSLSNAIRADFWKMHKDKHCQCT